ncbi:bifunctional phosphopantothenoylcysteine decarboxylase/phosphopantothenate--cysteine ligase CoaBC [Robertkochia solimangrovi]|uniref:bifunctional phosphopantothenoylcysteine decarboxylase/phosphopantothenate--cysteine ligase CoaBC n=1 Tax=Robertkochia solimangrovi TaxID=2213046 RepID=UPI00117DF4FB|nr:bifunctional phosphopantothenoylcysteine decarboxylase/phosphopantothenate--cysteine ligase CoaBC [Robertkochia solimangrovi]TRZ41075.1 bifunctional phosphopantothenoylcysteine decarboxylase/phosphopantothenate--cysteine ligase CoaBC [Robertkochia solimangrovi]
MSVLGGKNILLGISGGIAAYKTAFLVRLFKKAGASVKVVMTESSKDFVTPLTLSALSGNPVLSSFVNSDEDGETWNNHVELGLWADLMIVAPATANTLSKMANGSCDNLLLAVYLSAKCPVYFAPAMDLDMYAHRTTQESFRKLESFGNIMIPAEEGELASGLVGKGRMAEPENILQFIENHIISGLPLRDKKVLITAGPTYEAIDPVRFIGNHSSGKMGYALAQEAAALGAEVVLVSGPTALTLNDEKIKVVPVVSAEEMYQAVHAHFAHCDIAILAAAVADYRPKEVADTKIKKASAVMRVDLEPTKDILASLGSIKENRFLVGFALETNNEFDNAVAKLKRKNLDAIVLNSLNDIGAGFGKPTNKITFIDKELKSEAFGLKAKSAVAKDIFNQIIIRLHA